MKIHEDSVVANNRYVHFLFRFLSRGYYNVMVNKLVFVISVKESCRNKQKIVNDVIKKSIRLV